MKLSQILFNSFYGAASSKIIYIPKSIKMPKNNYIEPCQWNFPFEKPSQVKPRAFIDLPNVSIGPKDDQFLYKNPEYFSYHTYSYYSIERDLFCKRCRPQPSPFNKRLCEDFDAKAP